VVRDPGDVVLDVGCGLGDDVALNAALAGTPGMAVGIDNSLRLLREALRRPRRTARAPGFVAADAHRLPFRDAAFDGCGAERVLQHLERPKQAIEEMVRVTKPGGRIVVSEPDAGMTAVDAGDPDITRSILRFRSDERATSFLGRQLFSMFSQAGLAQVRVAAVADVIKSFSAAEDTMGLTSAAARAAASGLVSHEAAAAWVTDLKSRSDAGQFLVAWVTFTAVGVKPGHQVIRPDRSRPTIGSAAPYRRLRFWAVKAGWMFGERGSRIISAVAPHPRSRGSRPRRQSL